MQINGVVSGDFEVKRIRFHTDGNIREAICVLTTRVRHDKGANIWGKDFTDLAFSAMHIVDGEPRWRCTEMSKPALVCEEHEIEINGQTIQVQPEIKKIKTVEDSAEVIVPLTMRIDLKTEKLAGKIAFAAGKVVDVKMQAKQLSMPGTNTNAGALKIVKGAHGNPKPVKA